MIYERYETILILAIKLTRKCWISDNKWFVEKFCFVENNLYILKFFTFFLTKITAGGGSRMEVDKATNEFTEHLPANSPMRTV